jgi:hypothetical protein
VRILSPSLALSLLLLGAPLSSAKAQQPPPMADPAPAPSDRATAEVAPPPNWSIKQEVERLDTSMHEYNALINSLGSASTDLAAELRAFQADPHNEVLASSVERKMAQYAQRVMGDFDAIIADQDVLSANFNDLQRKLTVFSRHLGTASADYHVRLDGYRASARDEEKKLTELSVRLKENPPEDPNALRLLKQEFAREFRRYRLQTRYVNGYQRRFRSYQQLQKNMERLAGVFVSLHEKFNELVDNLENERQYLQDSLRLQADTVTIKRLIRDGVIGSEAAIGNVADKLATLYNHVDAFATVHERINGDLNNFVESQDALMDVTRKIDAIGATGGPIGDIGADMDKAIETFYGRRNDTGDSLLGEDAQPETEEQDAEPPAAPATEGGR